MKNEIPGTQLFLLNEDFPPHLCDNRILGAFFVQLEEFLKSQNIKKRRITNPLENIIIDKSECGLVIDLSKNKIVYKKGIQKLLGYDENEFTIELLRKIYHPDDYEITACIIKNATLYSLAHPEDNLNSTLLISNRMRKKDGSYIKIMSQSKILETDEKGRIISFLIRYTDISFIDKTDYVKWEFKSKNLNKAFFKQQVYIAYQNYFTNRETSIIHSIEKGFLNRQIANHLNISEYTVATHRKNILRKANCHDATQLIQFCSARGIL